MTSVTRGTDLAHGSGDPVPPDPPSSSAASARARHVAARDALAAQLRAIPPGGRVRLAKRTSNLFRPRDRARAGLDVSGLRTVLAVDPDARTADVQGMTTYEDLVAATLPHGLMPYVVPQLKTITLGGAVTGLGIESSSFRNGLPHESVREMEILTGDGEVVLARPDGPHADLFRAFPNSYGSLGYATRLLVDLEPVQPYVRLRHVRFASLAELVDAVGEVTSGRRYGGEPVDFLDGTVFTADEAYLTLGRWEPALHPGEQPSDYTKRHVFYQSIPRRRTDVLTVHDYLWRWDTDWFWCSRAFGAQHPLLRRVWPRRWLRSDVYWRIVALENRHHLAARIDRLRGLPPRERVIQDVEIPLGRTADFLQWFLRSVPVTPLWLCPVRLRDSGSTAELAARNDGVPWPLYPLRPGETYVNVGFWSTVAIADGARDGDVNRLVERAVADHDGHKSLYSDSYYDEAEFWSRYGGAGYADVKRRYDGLSRLPDLYTKAVRRA